MPRPLQHNAANRFAVAVEKYDATGEKIHSPRRRFPVPQPKGIGFRIVFDFAVKLRMG